ncbi:NAD(P)-dependent oxidoreductase [Paraburkholderia tagetis]|uniref:NAD(P)-dependent oxidoreductase n=1 Tax=Paraburkholderia tagetis TaxID=2913261 RepID=A0A9X1RPP0_9BURK|nr:NAD(P)-dependent oxidoreductase [Paraburkholderia tagetis]MCG5073641.1 NAD(P)-dependent oxidoreductase [Paraburkholderia tagetis]
MKQEMEKMQKQELGFCGPGLMGAPMIRHLLHAGNAVRVWNRSPEKAEALVADGARVAATPAELAQHTDVVLLCVADGAAVEQVVFGEHGLLSAAEGEGGRAARVRRIVDHSSIPPELTRKLAARAAALGVGWVDAPVSGGVAGAQAGSLAVMAGGTAEDVDAVAPILAAYAARVTHMGGPGAGQTTKLCNQAIVTATVAAIAEAVGLARRSGIDAAKLPEALAGGWADSTLLRTFVPRMTQDSLAPIGALKTFQKDVDTVADAARQTGTPMPVAGTVQQILRLGAAMGLAEADLSGFIDVLQTPRHA